jgi:hypothetical protein
MSTAMAVLDEATRIREKRPGACERIEEMHASWSFPMKPPADATRHHGERTKGRVQKR